MPEDGHDAEGGPEGAARPSPAWVSAVAAVALIAIDPKGLGGLVLRGPADPARDRLLALHRNLLPPSAPVRKMPVGVADARLLGGLELTATLAAGRPVLQRGLLAEADGGALVIPGCERLSAGVAGRLAMALDAGAVAIAREGFEISLPARFAVLACDEALTDEDPPPAILTERLGLIVSLKGIARADLDAATPRASDVAAARGRLRDVAIPDAATEALAEAALKLGVFGLRPLLFARAAARASAALAGRETVEEADLALAARLALGPRATQAPAPAQESAEAPQPDQSDASQEASGERDDASDADPREMAEQVLEAAAATIPPDILASLASSPSGRAPSRTPGKAGAALASKRRGRPIGARAGDPGGGARLDLLETLRAAAPWQRVRRRALSSPLPAKSDASDFAAIGRSIREHPNGAGERSIGEAERVRGLERFPDNARPPHPALRADLSPPERGEGRGVAPISPRILVRREDFRIQRLKERRRTVTIFVVDASGSAALHRLAEAKGAVELLLAQAYVRRDEVALIAFRGVGAELLLPPTRSLARAKRSLAGLPGGGGTPLASAIDAAALMVDAARRRGDTPVVVFLTDGAANVARDGTGGRAKAQDEAKSAARGLKAYGCSTIVVDVSPRPQARAKELAEAMGARYAPLPSADAAAVARAVG